MKYELTIYSGGTAVLTDDEGETLWTSDADDEFAKEFDEVVTFDDGDDIAEYLEDSGLLPTDCALDIVETDDTGLHAVINDDDDDEDDDEDDEEDS